MSKTKSDVVALKRILVSDLRLEEAAEAGPIKLGMN